MQNTMYSKCDLPSILDSVSYAVVAVDTHCRVIYLNKGAELFFLSRKRPIDACLGNSCEPLLPLATPKIVEAMRDDAFRAGKGRIVDKGNDLFFEITPLMQQGAFQGAVVSLQRPERFEELAVKLDTYQHMAQQLKAIFQSSSDGIWVTDGQGYVLDINKASERLNGIDSSTLRGKNILDLLENGHIDDSATIHVQQSKQQQTIIQNVPGTGRQLLVTGTPVFNDKGELILVVANERDITDLNTLHEHLDQARKAQEKVQRELDTLTMLELKQGGVVAESKAMRQVLTTCLKLSQLEATNILLLGESGTGKGLLAKFIHKSGPRKNKPFISVNCASLPDALFEAELFGYEKGAFTGALESGRIGLMQLAGEGTLFLDEVAEIPLASQAKLLKCLDEREYRSLGGTAPKHMECNIIAATNRDLENWVQHKRFRGDLLYRLNTFTVSIPPLRDRLEDIFELTTQLLGQENAKYKAHKRISTRGMNLLQDYPFPGNVRELMGIIRKGVVMCDDALLDDFIAELLHKELETPQEEHPITLTSALDKVEREMLSKARSICSGTREMAQFLGVSQATVVRKLQKHGMRAPGYASAASQTK